MTVRFCDNCGIIQGCCNLLRNSKYFNGNYLYGMGYVKVAHVAPQDTSEKRWA